MMADQTICLNNLLKKEKIILFSTFVPKHPVGKGRLPSKKPLIFHFQIVDVPFSKERVGKHYITRLEHSIGYVQQT